MATYLIPVPSDDGSKVELRKVTRIPRSGYYLLASKPDNGKDAICTGRTTDGTVTHANPSKPEYEASLLKHHGAWCNAVRETAGAALVERAASRTSVDPAAKRAERWAAIAGDVVEA